MTAWVRTDCPDCGGLYLPAHEVAAWMMLPAVDCSYSFSCLHCRRLVERPCSTSTLDQLARSGVHLTTVIVPVDAAPIDTGSPVGRAGEALTEAEVVTFCRLLADDDAFAPRVTTVGSQLTTAVRAAGGIALEVRQGWCP